MKWLAVLALFSCIATAGCGSAPDEADPVIARLMQLTGGQSAPAVDPRFTALLEDGAPALQIGFIESGLSGIVLLERKSADFTTWRSPDGSTFVLQSGMLHGLQGVGTGLLASDVSASLRLVRGRQVGTVTRVHTFLTGNDKAQSRSFRCAIENKGARQIALGERAIQTTLMQETCRSLTDNFFNLYWVAGSEIVQSRQWSGAFNGAISMRQLPNPV